MLELFNKDNILEGLNNIDARTNNKYDLVNIYSSKALSNKQVHRLSEMLDNKASPVNIHQFLEDIEEDKPIIDQKEFENLIMELNEYLRANNFYEFAYQVGKNAFEVEINWGDWKHEHLRLQIKVHNFFRARGYEIMHEREIIEDDGSDTYSAIHTFEVVGKNIDDEAIVKEDLAETSKSNIFTDKKESDEYIQYTGTYNGQRYSMTVMNDKYRVPRFRGKTSIKSIHPYDDAIYSYAISDTGSDKWKIYFNGKSVKEVTTPNIKHVLDIMQSIDKDAESKIIHN